MASPRPTDGPRLVTERLAAKFPTFADLVGWRLHLFERCRKGSSWKVLCTSPDGLGAEQKILHPDGLPLTLPKKGDIVPDTPPAARRVARETGPPAP